MPLVPIQYCCCCAACPISVSVGPERLSAAGTTWNSGHHARFVQSRPLLATAAPVLGVDGAFLLEARPSRCAIDRRLGGAPVRRFVVGIPQSAGCRRSPCAIQDDDRSGSPSLGADTCANHHKALMIGAIRASSLLVGARSDDATGADDGRCVGGALARKSRRSLPG